MTRNERALKIAEYKTWTIPQNHIDEYSSFNGLMPVFCEINISTSPLSIMNLIDEIRITKNAAFVKSFDYDSDKPETLIDALQQAIIFYYENK